MKISEIFTMLSKNRYISLFFLITIISNVITNMGMMVYYAKWVLGDLGVQSLFAAFSALAVIGLVILPKLMKHFSVKQILMAGLCISMAANLISFIFYKTIPVLIACYVINMLATVPGVYINKILFFDNATYNEYLGLHRMEGTMGAVQGFMGRLGAAIGTFCLGLLLTLIGYDADAAVLANGTLMGLRAGQFLLPIAGTAIQLLFWSHYNLESKLPEIQAELAKRKAEA